MNLRKTLLTASVAAALPMLTPCVVHAAGPLMAAPVSMASAQESAGLVAQLASRDAQRGVAGENSFRVNGQHPGVVGEKITRVQHTFKGLRVFGSEAVVVTNNTGEIVSESVSDRRAGLAPNTNAASAASAASAAKAANSANGADSATGSLAAKGVEVARSVAAPVTDVAPALSATDAIAKVVKAVSPSGAHRYAPTAELLIYPVMKSVRVPSAVNKSEAALNATDLEEVVERYVLAYYVQTRMTEDRKPVYFDTIIDAKTGVVVAQWKALQTVIGTGNSQYNGAVPINTTLSGGTYRMLDSTRGTGGKFGGMAITNANHASADSPSPGTIYTNSSNVWGDGKQYIAGGSTTGANGQTAAVNALWGLMNTYDTNKNVLGWQSLDGNNTATYIAAHVDTAYDNAFFDPGCKCMYIGDGGASFNNLGSIDVIGHEMSHGITDATSNLTYAGESGGLNESHSDIGGEMVEAYARAGGKGTVVPATGNDWMTGKEIAKNGQPLRWLYKPSKDGRSPNAWSSTIKNIDVHLSSGPNNRMFYFLSQGSKATSSSDYYSQYLVKSPAAMTGIGNDKAYRIWFKALTTKFTSSTNYATARSKVLLAAQELYGVGSKEAIAVQRAYAAINVGADVNETASAVSLVTQ